MPIWKANLLVFGLLIVIVLAYFFWQARQADETFLNHARDHSRMLAGVIELNARNAVLSQEAVEEIMQIFLGNMARFADYLDTVEPFSSDELAAFAQEAGLSGIRIVRSSGSFTEGPSGWFGPSDVTCETKARSLQHYEHLYFAVLPRSEEPGCIIVGITASHIEKLHEQVGLSHVLKALSGLAGIQYVGIECCTYMIKKSSPPQVLLIDESDRKVAETRVPFRGDMLVVALGAKHFFFRIRQLWNEFFVFGAMLALTGIFFSWILYRYQTSYMNRIRDVERELARQREDASLGRATAAITHEIRNPLNAIGMGLQRLQIEAEDLDEEYQELVATMLKALRRTNSIVSDLRRYAGPPEPRKKAVCLNTVVNHIIALYRQKCAESAIEIICENTFAEPVSADPEMLEQVVENLIKNSIEAQPGGGWLHTRSRRQGNEAVLIIENSGFALSAEESGRILEPYFTTKVRGTGLGLAISRRIIQAHGGRLEVRVPAEGILRIEIYLPLSTLPDKKL